MSHQAKKFTLEFKRFGPSNLNSSRRSQLNELSILSPNFPENSTKQPEFINTSNENEKTQKNTIDTKKLAKNSEKQQKNITLLKNNQNQKNIFALNSHPHSLPAISRCSASCEQALPHPALTSNTSTFLNVSSHSQVAASTSTSSSSHVDTPPMVPLVSPLTSSSSILSVQNSPNEAKVAFSQLLIPVTLYASGQELYTLAMLDSGASCSFMNTSFVEQHAIKLQDKNFPNQVQLIDGSLISSGPIQKETVPIRVSIGNHSETLCFDITNLGKYPLLLGIDWLLLHNPVINWVQKSLIFSNCQCLREFTPNSVSCYFSSDILPSKYIPSCPDNFLSSPPLSIFSLSSLEVSSSLHQVPSCYSQFSILFSELASSTLPPHRPFDHKIELIPDATIPFGPIYSLSAPELECLRKYLNEMLEKGFIRVSKSPAASPLLFATKNDGGLRPCIDYRALNQVTVKNRYPLPLIHELLDRLQGATIFTKLDLRGAYNLIRIADGHEWKTAFRTRYGLFEYLVMPFGLTNAPATFQAFLNSIFTAELDIFLVIYLDDLLIFSKSSECHIKHVSIVLQKLLDNSLYLKPEKCSFHADRVEFLGYEISPNGVSMSPSKISSIREWPIPRSIKEVQAFLGFANFYRRFVPKYSHVTNPLTCLLKKDASFSWDKPQTQAFESLISVFTSSPVLCHFDASLPITLETDASDFAIGGVLSQIHPDKITRPVAFYSRKLTSAEINYDVYNKEMLAIIECIRNWRCYLEGYKFTVLTDHKNLAYFQSMKSLNRRQARWSERLSGLDFTITYQPGVMNGKADALSRRHDYATSEGEIPTPLSSLILKPESIKTVSELCTASKQNFTVLPSNLADVNMPNDLYFRRIVELLPQDFLFKEFRMYEKSHSDIPQNYSRIFPHLKIKYNALFFKEFLYVPDDTSLKNDLCFSAHDSPVGGHFGQEKTYRLLSRKFWFPKMRDYVIDYVSHCDTCQRIKDSRHSPYGLLQPLPIPEGPWKSVSMDFIVKLPLSYGFDSILVVVDRFSKMAHFIACNEAISSLGLALLYFNNVFKLHGLPHEIISDRGPVFVSKFWTELLKVLGTKAKHSSAFHPQTDGQTERVNSVLEQYLRGYVNMQQDNWSQLLCMAEFSYNNSVHSSIKCSPFFANFGYDLRFDPQLDVPVSSPAAIGNAQKLHEIHDMLKINLSNSQKAAEKYYNLKRKNIAPFMIGDFVWLLSRNIRTDAPCKKLSHRRLGPFKITSVISPVAYRLELPPDTRIHNVFHISLLEKYKVPRIPSPLPSSPTLQADTLYEIAAFLDSRLRNGKVEYYVDWSGYGPEDRTWMVLDDPNKFSDLLTFHQNFPTKPVDTRLRLSGASA